MPAALRLKASNYSLRYAGCRLRSNEIGATCDMPCRLRLVYKLGVCLQSSVWDGDEPGPARRCNPSSVRKAEPVCVKRGARACRGGVVRSELQLSASCRCQAFRAPKPPDYRQPHAAQLNCDKAKGCLPSLQMAATKDAQRRGLRGLVACLISGITMAAQLEDQKSSVRDSGLGGDFCASREGKDQMELVAPTVVHTTIGHRNYVRCVLPIVSR